MRLPPGTREGSSFDSSFWGSFGSTGISTSHDGKCHKAINSYNRSVRFFFRVAELFMRLLL